MSLTMLVRFAKQLLILSIVLLTPAASSALSTTSWQLAPPVVGNWNHPINWSNGAPTGVFGEIALIKNGGIASISADATFRDVILGQAATENGKLLQDAHTVILAGDLYVGEFGTGTYEFSGGLLRSGDVFVGVRPGSQGTILVSGGVFNPGYILMGRAFNIDPAYSGGYATMIQTAGTVEVFYAALTIEGNQSNYQLQGGTLRALDQIVHGRGLNNRFVQTGGTNDAHNSSGGVYYSGALRVGLEADQLATYELSGGDLLSNYTCVGCYKGQGLFVQTGGQHHVYGNLGVAWEEMSAGDYELHGGTLTVDGTLNIGTRGDGSFTTFGQNSMVQVRDLSVASTGSISYSISHSGISPTTVTRNATVAGLLTVLDDGALNGKYLLVDAVNSLTFNPANIQLPGPNWSWQQEGTQLFVERVPEPSLTLVLTSIFGFVITRRRLPLLACPGVS